MGSGNARICGKVFFDDDAGKAKVTAKRMWGGTNE
jgi:hypothetical protein